MGNRLTLPLLLLAALLAGGAFFWLSGGDERGSGARGGAAPTEQSRDQAPAELVEPEVARPDEPQAGRPVREELAAPAPAASAPSSASAAAAVTGRVVDAAGAPVAGARVTLAAQTGFPIDLELDREFPWLKRQRTETDAEGRYRFAAVDPGVQQVAVHAAGFAPFEKQGLAVAAAGGELEPFVLVRGAILTGIVVDPDGRGVAGAEIVRSDIEGGSGLFFVGGREPTAVTGPDGRFRVDQLACGAWRFVVRSKDHPDLVVEGLAEEPGVEVAGLRWQLAPGATIAGTVTGVPASERGRLEVRARRGSSADPFEFGGGRSAKVEANGSFVLRGCDVGGDYTLQARRARDDADSEFWERSRSDSVRARSGETGILLTYQPEAALLFTVLDAETRAPIERFQVEVGIEWPVPLRDDDGRTREFFPNGEVRAGGLRPGSERDRAQLVVRATGYEELHRSDISVRAGQELDLGAIYLAPVPVVRVRVLDAASGKPVPDALVRMQKQAEGGHGTMRRTIAIGDDEGVDSLEFGEGRSARTDDDGWAELTSFEGGTVDLTARAKGYAPGKLSGVFLPTGERVEQELRLTLGGEVLVTVLDASGAPLPGASVEHRSPSDSDHGGMVVLGGSRSGAVLTDSSGQVLFPNLAPGLHSFRIGENSGGGAAFVMGDVAIAGMGAAEDEGDWTQLSVGEGERGEVTLRAAPRGRLTGRVREAGKVLPGATLSLGKERDADQPAMPAFPGADGGPETRSDGEGRYVLSDVKEGRYLLTVTHPTRRMPAEFPVTVREGENSFDVDLGVSVISGRVVDEEGKPLAGVRVWPERKTGGGPRMRFAMVMVDDGGGGVVDSGRFGERTTTDAEGRYTLRGVTSDADLVVKAEGDAVQPGESEVVRLAPDEVKDGVDLRLGAAGSIKVQARLPDGSPARMQLVQAEFTGDADPRPQPKFGFMQEGSTVLKGLKPGPWRVTVRSAQGSIGGPGEGQEREVRVEAGVEATAEFDVE